MNKIIKIGAKEILVHVKSFVNAKSVKLSVQADGRVLLTKPSRISNKIINSFIIDRINWLEKSLNKINITDNANSLSNSSVNFKNNKEEARQLVLNRLSKFEKFYNIKPQRISIRNQRTRWGSCSHKGSLNFNYRLVFLDSELVDYIIVHELCHLQEFNHSPSFWRLVAKAIPNHSILRKKLKNIKIV